MKEVAQSHFSKRLRILMISPQYRPIVGGYERSAERLSAALVLRGHDVTVITERRETLWPARDEMDGVRILRLWCIHRPRLHLLTSLLSFSRFLLIRGRSFDVLHVHQYGLHAALASAFGIILRRPVVLKLTSSADQGLKNVGANSAFARLTHTLIKRVSAVVAMTRETEREALAFGIARDRIHRLGNGVDVSKFCSVSDQERSELKKKFGIEFAHVVLFVGRLSEEKNIRGLLQAWRLACSSLATEWGLVLVGGGSQRAELEAVVTSAGLKNRVLFVGQQANIENWMRIADIYVLSSRNEGLSNTMLEAMASALPVVATRVSGVSELVEEANAGLAVDVGDMHGLGRALVSLACDAALRDLMGSTARSVIEQGYSIEAVTEGYESMYYQLLAEEG